MALEQFNEAEISVIRDLSSINLYMFTRWMFRERRGYQWTQARHHALICNALERVFNGETKRLIINIPPRYSKTEIAVVNFIAWAMGRVPDCEFIHASYSATLAVNNSVQIRNLVQHEEYRAIFPDLALASESSHHWKTTAGGVMYATGTGGTITGFGAGKHREGFGGCFPVGTMVWTEKGLIAIDEIVEKRLPLRVWAYDYQGNLDLMPVTAWHRNPANAIVRVTFNDGETVECTPCHRFWTLNRGWVRADLLAENDVLPRVNRSIEDSNNLLVHAKSFSGGGWGQPIIAACPVGAVVNGFIPLFPGKFGAEVRFPASLIDNIYTSSYGTPARTAPYSLYDTNTNVVSFSKFNGWGVSTLVNVQNLAIGQNSEGMSLGFAKCSVQFTVRDVALARVISQVFQPVIAGVAVRMANISPIWAFTHKREHDKAMNGCGFYFGADAKVNAQVSARHNIALEQFPFDDVVPAVSAIDDCPIFAADTPKITNGINPFISGNRKPSFVEYVRHDDVTYCLTVEKYHNFIINSGLVVKNCIIIDDPHKADEARSEVRRQNVIDWFQNTLESRKNSPETPIILIMQRLHENDLAGWLLDGGNGEEWEHLCLPAIQDDGTALWPEKHDIETLRRMEQAAPYVFAGQYLQKPAPPDGGTFKPDNLQFVKALPAGNIRWVRAWDLASTANDGDYTAGGRLGVTEDGRYIIANIVRGQYGADERDRILKNTAQKDGVKTKISIPQDPGQAGKSQTLYLTRQLAGFSVSASPESGDKVTRAEPFAAQVNIGNVMLLDDGTWDTDALISEMRMFPNGQHDDQIDCLSRAFGELLDTRTGMIDYLRSQVEANK